MASALYNNSEVYDSPLRFYDGTLASPPLTVGQDGTIRINEDVLTFLNTYLTVSGTIPTMGLDLDTGRLIKLLNL